MITGERVRAAIEDYSEKLKVINDCIKKEMARPYRARRTMYLTFLVKEKTIYEFATNELIKLNDEN